MKKTKIVIECEIDDTANTIASVKNFISNMIDNGIEDKYFIDRNCDNGNIGFSMKESTCYSKSFVFNDFASFINKYVEFINKWNIASTTCNYYLIKSVKAETIEVPEEKKEEDNGK